MERSLMLEMLHHDELVLTLQQLSISDLFRAAATCRRLQQLAPAAITRRALGAAGVLAPLEHARALREMSWSISADEMERHGEQLVRLMSHPQQVVRLAAVCALGRLQTPALSLYKEQLLLVLGDDAMGHTVRKTALNAFMRLGPAAVAEADWAIASLLAAGSRHADATNVSPRQDAWDEVAAEVALKATALEVAASLRPSALANCLPAILADRFFPRPPSLSGSDVS
eukprot:scaffold215348_cov30-Tisochrysis_lutea.AAC.1